MHDGETCELASTCGIGAAYIRNIVAHVPADLINQVMALWIGTLNDQFHAAIGQVANKADYVKPLRYIHDGVTKTHALHLAAEMARRSAHTFHGRQSTASAAERERASLMRIA